MTTHELAIGYLIMANVDFAMLLVDSQEQHTALPHTQEALLLARKQFAAQNGKDASWQSILAFAEVAAGRSLVTSGQKTQGPKLLESGLGKLREL